MLAYWCSVSEIFGKLPVACQVNLRFMLGSVMCDWLPCCLHCCALVAPCAHVMLRFACNALCALLSAVSDAI